MLNAHQTIHDYKIEWLRKLIGKQIAYITLPPKTTIDLSNFTVFCKEITMEIHDCFEAGRLEFINAPFEGNGAFRIDNELHQTFHINIDKSYSPSDVEHLFSPIVHMPLPSYGTFIAFDNNHPKFLIEKIEIYSEDFILDENYKNIGNLEIGKKYSKKAVHVNCDSLVVFYDKNKKILAFEANRGGFNIYSNFDSISKVIHRKINGYASYENPVMLKRRITLENEEYH